MVHLLVNFKIVPYIPRTNPGGQKASASVMGLTSRRHEVSPAQELTIE